MDLEQCYKELEGDYAEVMRRLRKEELVHRFLIKFLESDEVQRIDEALQERDYEKAFDLVHTLKGETMTLGLGRLSKSSIILCEQLRYKIYGEEMLQQFRKVRMDYQKTIDIIRKYRDRREPVILYHRVFVSQFTGRTDPGQLMCRVLKLMVQKTIKIIRYWMNTKTGTI